MELRFSLQFTMARTIFEGAFPLFLTGWNAALTKYMVGGLIKSSEGFHDCQDREDFILKYVHSN
jgi:hypothetical protein